MTEAKVSDEEYTDLFKLVLVGDATVGKTCLLNQYMKGTMPAKPSATIGVEFANTTVRMKDNTAVKVQIWDTAGQERYRAITSAHYRGAMGALLVFDLTRKDSFEHCARWLEEIRQRTDPESPIIALVGNKADVVESDHRERQVSEEEARAFAKQNRLLFFETSAESGQNVREAFSQLIEGVFARQSKVPRKNPAANVKISQGGDDMRKRPCEVC